MVPLMMHQMHSTQYVVVSLCLVLHKWIVFIVWNLSNGVDVDETRKAVEKYKKDNEALIRKNNVKMVYQHMHMCSDTVLRNKA